MYESARARARAAGRITTSTARAREELQQNSGRESNVLVSVRPRPLRFAAAVAAWQTPGGSACEKGRGSAGDSEPADNEFEGGAQELS